MEEYQDDTDGRRCSEHIKPKEYFPFNENGYVCRKTNLHIPEHTVPKMKHIGSNIYFMGLL